MEEIRLLTKDDIEVRVAQTTTTGTSSVKVNLLLYKNARIDMKILDELYTSLGWKRSHKLIGNNLYCQVDVWDAERKEWVSKEDVGVESNTEAEKGQASDAFKRACVNWGIGRELYTAPKISVELNEKEYSRDQNSKIRVWASFSVGSIEYDRKTRTITGLQIVDKYGNIRYSMAPAAQAQPEQPKRTRAKKAEPAPAPAAPEYRPMDDATYWKVIEKYVKGIPAMSGMDYKQTWAEMTNAGPDQLAKFEYDADNVRAAMGIL